MTPRHTLPEPLPAEPLSLVAAWLAEAQARGETPNPNAMVLATCDDQGRPSARVVLCKDISPVPGVVRFVTNYLSRKGREMAANPRAALVFHWDHLHRQARIEGAVRQADAADSDRYFASRARGSQLGAHASRQSEPIASRAALRAQLDEVRDRYGDDGEVPRPAHWGIMELWADAVELWVEGHARLHDRARWTRAAANAEWAVTRLQP
ncbi:MAG: pyridoxamine 5'-phosphate oxidase [Nevskiaceae bacterium]|jgi:pyridoxamine 5'-phosphate oxidase|nr:pyridoxamine 5'-phosphate oxidase [Nevskiaceae bacterium]